MVGIKIDLGVSPCVFGAEILFILPPELLGLASASCCRTLVEPNSEREVVVQDPSEDDSAERLHCRGSSKTRP